MERVIKVQCFKLHKMISRAKKSGCFFRNLFVCLLCVEVTGQKIKVQLDKCFTRDSGGGNLGTCKKLAFLLLLLSFVCVSIIMPDFREKIAKIIHANNPYSEKYRLTAIANIFLAFVLRLSLNYFKLSITDCEPHLVLKSCCSPQ